MFATKEEVLKLKKDLRKTNPNAVYKTRDLVFFALEENGVIHIIRGAEHAEQLKTLWQNKKFKSLTPSGSKIKLIPHNIIKNGWGLVIGNKYHHIVYHNNSNYSLKVVGNISDGMLFLKLEKNQPEKKKVEIPTYIPSGVEKMKSDYIKTLLQGSVLGKFIEDNIGSAPAELKYAVERAIRNSLQNLVVE